MSTLNLLHRSICNSVQFFVYVARYDGYCRLSKVDASESVDALSNVVVLFVGLSFSTRVRS